MPKTLRLVLGDQLSDKLESLKDIDKDNDIVLICEVKTEATYVKHHKKKIILIFSAMRHFAQELISQGIRVNYVKYDDPKNTGSLLGEIKRNLKKEKFGLIEVTHPGEHRLLAEIQDWKNQISVPVKICDDTRFLSPLNDFKEWATGRKQLRMEFFYREMRKKTSTLMEGEKPAGGQWNYDSENRKTIPTNINIPEPIRFKPNAITVEVIELVEKEFKNHFGSSKDFHFAVTRDQATEILEHFIEEKLKYFGNYQDAMVEGKPWLFHSHISFYLNCGLLDPLEVIKEAERAYLGGKAKINAVEGFIRQILGWREFVRGIYWLKMPEYADFNYFNAKRPLPKFFWSGKTKMNCLSQCITETSDNAYAHHIQRLMVLGNFLLLSGVSPEEVNEWYLVVYADAYEWVQMPNVSGMVLFADGGILASKPYASSGAYINRMSNYCKSCSYMVKEKNGTQACPFNYLYWNFLDHNKLKLSNNPRLGMPYKNLSKMPDEKIDLIRKDSKTFLKALETNQYI